MAQPTDVSWTTCEEAGCIGIRLAEGRMCLAHANPEMQAEALLLVRETGTIDVRGVPITRELLKQVLDACPRGSDGQAVVHARFGYATFTGDASFGEAIFEATSTDYVPDFGEGTGSS
ncbi:hypothetical protein AB0E63_43130 [Kribbella sp. NPDC026596]|uniref:hypothetical protein n=1 Tax=Kribbella sp. NPDC026596 TaxID=3155122 RepID=UPI0033F36AEE